MLFRSSISTDGKVWRAYQSSIRTNGGTGHITFRVLNCAAANGNTVVALSANPGFCMMSYDGGIVWIFCPVPQASIYSVTYGGPGFCAVGLGMTMVSTDNAKTWTRNTLNANARKVIWDGARYVAVGDGWCGTSADGQSWTPVSIPSGYWTDIHFNGTQYVVVGRGAVLKSTVLGTWTAGSIALDPIDWSSIAWNGSLYVTVGVNWIFGFFQPCKYIAASYDGLTWYVRSLLEFYASSSGSGANPTKIVWIPETKQFVIVGDAGEIGRASCRERV